MVITILLLLLIVLAVAAVHFFLFSVFIPSLKAQQVDADDPVYAKEELDFYSAHASDGNVGILSAVNIPLKLLSAEDRKLVEEEPKTNKRVFSFWQKCYNMFRRK